LFVTMRRLSVRFLPMDALASVAGKDDAPRFAAVRRANRCI
jgi:hypothetical protein